MTLLLSVAIFDVCFGAQAGYNYQQRYGQGNSDGNNVAILDYQNNLNPDGSYNYRFSAANGINAEESGYLKNIAGDAPGSAAEGSYSYTGDDGAVYAIRYVADENGFRPEGAHLPTPPPIPDAILRALEYNKQHESKHQNQGGQNTYNNYNNQRGYS